MPPNPIFAPRRGGSGTVAQPYPDTLLKIPGPDRLCERRAKPPNTPRKCRAKPRNARSGGQQDAAKAVLRAPHYYYYSPDKPRYLFGYRRWQYSPARPPCASQRHAVLVQPVAVFLPIWQCGWPQISASLADVRVPWAAPPSRLFMANYCGLTVHGAANIKSQLLWRPSCCSVLPHGCHVSRPAPRPSPRSPRLRAQYRFPRPRRAGRLRHHRPPGNEY